MMFDSVLKLTDTLLGLVNKAEARTKSLYDIHVEEIFNQMADIHKDYRTKLREVILIVHSDQSKDGLYELVSNQKIEMEPIRYKIHSLGIHSKSAEGLPVEIREFLLSCAKYLNVYFHERKAHFHHSDKEFDYEYDRKKSVPDPDGLEDCYSAMYSGLIEVISLYQSDRDLDLFKKRVYGIQDLLLQRWSDVTVAYAKARLIIHS